MGGRARLAAIGLAATALASACGAPGAESVTGFALEYETGSIPPPGNYAYRIEGSVVDGELDLTYALTYRFREGMTVAELAELGYSTDDDLNWSTALSGDEAQAWLDIAGRAELQNPGESLPGSDSIRATVRFADGSERSGEPVDRDAWEAMADELDRSARQALDHPRSSR